MTVDDNNIVSLLTWIVFADGGGIVAPLPSQSLSMAQMPSQVPQREVRVNETQQTT